MRCERGAHGLLVELGVEQLLVLHELFTVIGYEHEQAVLEKSSRAEQGQALSSAIVGVSNSRGV